MSSFTNNPNPNPNNQQPQPSMLSAHAQYAQGYASETMGNLTGSKEWQESGKQTAEEGIANMKV